MVPMLWLVCYASFKDCNKICTQLYDFSAFSKSFILEITIVIVRFSVCRRLFEPPHDKTNKMTVRPAIRVSAEESLGP